MDMESSLMTFTIDDNGVAQSADGSLIWHLQPPSGEQSLQEEDEAAEFIDRADGQYDDIDDDDVAYQSDPEFGYSTEETVQGYNDYLDTVVIVLNLLAQQQELDFETALHRFVYGQGANGDGLLGTAAAVVPASVAAVAGLEKHAFHATAEGRGVTAGCAICLEDFEDGEEVTVMPCSREHEFHPVCITEWLGHSNTCPLCRHALPTDAVMDDDDGL